MKTNWFKRTLCSILALVMVLGYVPATAFAAEEDGLCEHHTQHTAECGYSAASEGRACNHKHADTCYETMTQCAHVHGDCGYVAAVEGHSCDCQPDENGEIVHTDGCGYVEAAAEIPCGHVCSEESGCITKVLNCQHQHDAACGYVEAAAETPCGFVCEECAKQEEAVCTGELDCPVSEHNDNCKMKEADETAVADKEAADAVAALIEALPALDEMKTKSLEEQGADYAQVQSAYDAYEKLTASQKALLPPAEEVFKPYFDYFNNQTQQAATGGTLDSGRITWTLDTSGTLTISGSGSMKNTDASFDQCKHPWENYKDTIRTIVISEGITAICQDAFIGLELLTKVEIANTVTEIADGAFSNCPAVTEFSIPASVTQMGSQYFAGLKGYRVDSNNTHYCSDSAGVLFNKDKTELLAFPQAYIGTYTIPSSVKKVAGIGYADGLTSLTIPYGVEEVGWIRYCKGLTSLEYPDSVASLRGCVGCSKVESIKLPAGLKEIPPRAFDDCKALKQIELPNSLTTIGIGAFRDCTSLTTVKIPDSVTVIGQGAFQNSGVSQVQLPENLTEIPNNMFWECKYLTEIQLPSTVESIGSAAFLGSGLTQVTIPAGIKELDDNAFDGCALKSVTFLGNAPSFGEDVFESVTATVYYNDNGQWTSRNMKNHGGTLTWKALQSETVDYGIKIGTAAVTNANLGSENWEYNPNSNILYLKDGFDASVSTTRSSLVVTVSGSVKAEKIRATGTALTLKDDGSSTTKDVLDVYWTGIQVDGGSLTAENLTLSVRASNNIAIFVGAESTADGTFTVKNAQVHAYSEGEQALQGISVGTLNVDGSSRVYGGTSRAAVSAIYIAQAGRFSSACHVEASANNGNGIYGKGITFPAYAYIRNTAPVGGSGDFTKKATATEYSGGNIQTYRSYEFVGLDHVTYTKNESGHKVSCNCNPAETLIFCEAHDWNYNLDDTDTIEAVCSSCNATGSVTLMPPMSLISDGITAREATLDGSIPGVTPEITYEGNLTEGKPVKAGQYTAKVTLGGQTASIGFTISVKDYGIKIDTEAITSEHLSGEGWSYDSKNNVLSLSSHRWTGALSVTRDDLTVIVDGAVTLYGLRAVNITIKGKTGLASDSFTVPGNYRITTTGDLTVKELSLRVPSIQNAEAIIVGESGTTAVGCFTVDNASVYATSTGEGKAVNCIVTGSIRVLGSSVVDAKCRMPGCYAIAARGSGSSFSEECHIIASGIYPGSGGWKTGGITLPDKGYFYEYGSYVLKSTVGKNITSGSDFIGTGHITCTPNGDVHKVVCKCAYPTTVISSQDHSWLYSLDTDTINAMCRACRATGSLKLEPPVETQSDGVTAREATLSGSIPGVENPVITYTGDNLENGKPVKAGSYTAKITLDEKTAEISFALTADPMLTAVATVTTGETTTPYSGLAEAVAAASVASGSTLKLLQDITLDTALEVGSGSFTLDLNDKNLNATCYDPLRISGGDLIITDTGTDSTKGSITNDFMGSAVRINGAKVSISGISINVYSQQFCYGVVMEAGELSISDCSVTSKAISNDYGIKAEGGKLTVSHCNFNSDTAIYFSGSEANISNNNIESKGSGVYAAGGTITLSENDISGNSGVLVVGDSTMVSITSGSITGETFDLHKEAGGTIALGLPADGEMGAAFPGGIQVENTTLVEILGEGTSYWIGTKEQTLSADTWKIDGDVTIRKHTQHTASGYVDEKTTPDSHTSTCIFCGEELTEPHSFVEEKVDAQYLKSAANCTAAATYYKSCVCGRAGTEFFEYGPIGDHNRDEKHKCSVCGHIGGSCGDNLIWTYDAATGILTVSGTGEMAYFLPWEDYADQVTALVIKSGATTISDTAFRGFKQLKTVSIGDTVTTIGSSAFLGCSKLESITIPASVSVIKDNAFSTCTKLSSVTLKEGLTAIEANAFEGCESLTELVIPNTVTAIGSMAFYNCTALRSINIPDGVKTISAYMFVSSGLTGITIPDSVTTIEKQAFAWCNSLSDEIVIPEKVTIIGENAFSWCGKIDEIRFMGNAPAVAQNAFTTVTANAYYPWDNETWTDDVKQNYGGTITWIAEGMPALTEIRVSTKPAKVVYIQNKDALDVTGGKLTLTYSDNTTTVIDLTADMVTGFDNTKLGQQRLTVTYEGCTTYLNVTVQEDPNATSGTWGDLTWKISESGILTISGIGEMLNHDDPNGWQDPSNPPVDGYPWHKHKDKITAVVVEEGLTSLAEIAFHGLENLTGVTLPDSLARIGDAAFIYCTALESIVIPENISSIGKEILVGSTSFKEITFTGNAPAFHAEAFVGVTATAYYPGNNATWTDSVKQNYGGNITWVPYGTVESRLELDLSELDGQTMAWIDGVPCTIQRIDDKGYVAIPHDNARIMTTYNYHVGDAADVHTQYPVSMKVWALEKQEDGSYKTNRVEELDNLLQYSGCSIRIVGVKGIRMITSISKSTRSALAGSGLAGYKLVEYGTALCRAGVVDSGAPMVLGTPGVKSNYAYKRGVADPIFKDTGSAIQYTNVLVGFTDEDCKEDIAMRPYMKLLDENGEEVVIYGGIVYRSIGYIAYQNRNAFQPGSAAYEYVWSIIHNVYGNQYDNEYKK